MTCLNRTQERIVVAGPMLLALVALLVGAPWVYVGGTYIGSAYLLAIVFAARAGDSDQPFGDIPGTHSAEDRGVSHVRGIVLGAAIYLSVVISVMVAGASPLWSLLLALVVSVVLITLTYVAEGFRTTHRTG